MSRKDTARVVLRGANLAARAILIATGLPAAIVGGWGIWWLKTSRPSLLSLAGALVILPLAAYGAIALIAVATGLLSERLGRRKAARRSP